MSETSEIQDTISDVLYSHGIGAFNGSQVACDGCSVWMKTAEWREHQAELIVKALGAAGLLPVATEFRRVFGLESVETGRPAPAPALLDEDTANRLAEMDLRIECREVAAWREVRR